jgi:hypothetical protein
MTNERWLKWPIARYYRSQGYKVSMKPAQVGNAMVDGIAIGHEGERIVIQVKTTIQRYARLPKELSKHGDPRDSESVNAGLTERPTKSSLVVLLM